MLHLNKFLPTKSTPELFSSPDDFVALIADGRFAGTLGRLLRSLDNGVAVLHRGWGGWLAVLAQNCAGFIWGITLGKGRIHSPGWATGRARDRCRLRNSRAWNSYTSHLAFQVRSNMLALVILWKLAGESRAMLLALYPESEWFAQNNHTLGYS